MTETMDGNVIRASAAFMKTAQRLPTIFDLDDQMCAILALIEDAESSGEEPTSGLEAQLALVETALSAKVESYVSVIRTLDFIHDARKAEADRLRARAATAERAADWLKERLLVHLTTTGQSRLETPRFTVSIAKNSVPTCTVLEEMLIPAEFKRTVVTTSIDKKAITAYVKATGEVVPGAEVVQREHVRIS